MLQQDYVTADETYHKVLLAKIKPTDKGSKKGYLWAVSAPKLGLVFFVYEDGSRSEQVILNVFSDYKGTIQSDAYAPYRKLESDAYPDIMRIACLQHVKRDFIDCGKEDKDAQEVVDTPLDNNYIERIQRYISLSRRNSMFFGSHEGASRAAILYSIAISCRLNGINLFEYICDVIEKTAEWQPNTPLEKYRNLLPDRWKKQ